MDEEKQEAKEIALEYAPFLEKFRGKPPKTVLIAHLLALKFIIIEFAKNKDLILPTVLFCYKFLMDCIPDMEKAKEETQKAKKKKEIE